MEETWICIQGMSIEENGYLSDQFLYPDNPEGKGRDKDMKYFLRQAKAVYLKRYEVPDTLRL